MIDIKMSTLNIGCEGYNDISKVFNYKITYICIFLMFICMHSFMTLN